ncbi:MAG: hypothetical protein IT376_03070 [Polyangiaceae bacterium]|nr:hypothetical protein [Polyangiaceae bacterium]
MRQLIGRGVTPWLWVVAGLSISCGGSAVGAAQGSDAGGAAGAGGGGTGGAHGGGSAGVSGAGGSGASPSLTECDAPGTCTLFATNCCGGYCDPSTPIDRYQPVNMEHVNDLEAQLCRFDIACPGCVSADDPSFFAACRDGECRALDLRHDQLSECQSDSDCRVRWGTDCCEDCGGGPTDRLVAYSARANLEAEVCPPNGGACPPCAPPPYPPYVLPYCGPDAHCAWTIVGP